MRESSRAKRIWVTKFGSGHCGTGQKQLQWKFWDHSQCPRCGADNETTLHVLQCRGADSDDQWDHSIGKLKEWLTENDVEDTFAELICTRLTEWRLGSDLTPIRSTDPEIRRLFDLQDSIGWKAFLEGVLDVEWQKFQQTQYDETGSRKTGKRWVVALIRKLWNTAWDMWQHRNEVQNHTVLGALADTVQRQVKEQF